MKQDLFTHRDVWKKKSVLRKLYQHYFNVVKSLNFTCPPVMFAGGLLSSDNLLRRLLMQKIGIEKVPISKYSPVEGAALMANISKNS